ncbi:MAG: hypothetical protein QE495_01305 [Acidovorax sp.]|uniref:hypothetical protein n=1 Tax=Acidovorax sp. TaxID=1872122 RepID=UPI002605DA1F|nr:hypothetical protein [Acidovorax sp.]MDH4425064.1 hypothetical protein [Acidovorax sp.]
MNILLPKAITASMIGAGTTIPVVDSAVGEVLWATGGTFTVGQRRVWDGYTYECVQAITGAPANTYQPGTTAAAAFWLKDEGAPTNRMAPFDKYLFTKARRTGSVTYVLNVGFATGVAIYGIEGDTLSITVKAGPGGADLIPPVTLDLWQQAFGEYEYLFGDLQRGTYYTLKNLPIHPSAEVTITVSRNSGSVEAAIGFISVGTWKQLLAPRQKISGTQYGMEAATQDYSYQEETARKDGTYIEVQGPRATNISLSCVIDADQAPLAKTLLDQVLGKAVAIEVSNLPKYSHLATVGKITGSVRSTDWITAQVDLNIKGNI